MKNLPEHRKGILGVIAAAFMWSTGGLLIKLITLNAMQISFFRCLIAALVFAIIFRKKVFKANLFTFLNAAFYSLVLIFFVLATKTTTAANAIFLQSTAPIYVLIFEPLINKTKYEKVNIITIIVCFLGMLLFFTGKLSPGDLKGNIFALLAGVAFAAFFLGMRKNDHKYHFSSIFYGNIIVAIICIPYVYSMQTMSFSNLWMVVFLGVFQIGLAYTFFSYGLKRILAIEASLLSLVEPVLNPFWVFIGYGEIPSLMAIIGGIIIIAAITARTIILETPMLKSRFKF